MKSYHVHRSAQCPTGAHVVFDEATGKDVTAGCDCPALVVRASGPPGPAEPHLMQWSRAELARLVGEFDRGYFDNDEAPERRTTQFLSAFQTEVLDMIGRSPLSAAVTLMSRAAPDQVVFDAANGVLSLRMMPGRWAVIRFPAGPDDDMVFEDAQAPGGDGGAVLWARATSQREQELTEDAIRDQVRELMNGPNWAASARATDALQDDGDQLGATLDELATMAELLEQANPAPRPLPVSPAPNGSGRRRGKGKNSTAKKRLPPKAKG